jgi:hypothetical protein
MGNNFTKDEKILGIIALYTCIFEVIHYGTMFFWGITFDFASYLQIVNYKGVVCSLLQIVVIVLMFINIWRVR